VFQNAQVFIFPLLAHIVHEIITKTKMNIMKKTSLTFVVLVLFSVTSLFSQTTLQTVNFEPPASGYTVSPAESNANNDIPDYWIRTNGTSPTIFPTNGFTTSNGTYYFAAEDLDYTGAGDHTVTFDAVSVIGYSNLQVKLLVGGRSGTSGIEGEEFLKIQYNMDGGGWTTRAQFIGDGRTNYYEDENADGTIDGSSIDETLSDYTYTIPTTGSSLQIRVYILCGGSEELAFDNLRVLGTAACTEPTVPTLSASPTSICSGGSSNITISGSLNDATQWHVYSGSCGITQVGTTGSGTYSVSPTSTTTYYIRGEGGCVTPASCGSVTITVKNSNTGTDVQTACDSLVWIDGNTYYANNNTVTHTLTNVAGCDSVVTLDLTVNYSNTGTDVQTACDSLVWIDGNTYYANNNTVTHTLTNVAGCDSVVTLDLTVNYANTGTDVQTACDSLVWIDGNTYYANNNTATHTLTNVAGCDSLVTLDLTVNYANTGIDVQTACDSLVWIDGNTYYANNNTVTHTLTNVAGCDSVVTLDLTVNYSNTGIDVQTACDSLVWIDGNTYYANNNTVTHTLTNVAGCDSVVTLDLTVNYSNTGTDVQTACDSLVWIDGNTYYANNNTVTHTLTNVAGCDSVVTLDLTVNYANTGTDVQTACDSLVWIDGNTYYANNNTATHTLTNVAGCDSLVTLDLTVNYANTGIDVQTACDSLVWIDGNTYYANNNTVTHTLTNVAGCDSIVTLDLTVNYSNTGTDVQTACDSLVWIDGNTYYANNNTVTHTLTNVAGCDSIVTLDLTVNTVDVSVTVNSITLTSTLSGASYQWVDCANSYAVIAGETNQSFTPTVNGDYAVIIDDGTCMDTSLCYLIISVGINDDEINSAIVIYPNPTSGLITIEGEDIEVVEVFDISGKSIYKTVIERSGAMTQSPIKMLNIDLSTYSKGIYLVNVKTNSGVVVRKIVLE
jgi:hypothetical protein